MTALKSCCRPDGSNAGMIRRIALLVSVAVAASFWTAPRVAADSAPDWLRALAQEKLPAYPADTIAVELLDESQTTVLNNGEIDTRHRVAYKLLRPEAKDQYGFAGVPFDTETKVTSFNAWTIASDGHEYALKDKDSVETSLSTYEVFSDDRAKLQRFPEANPGSVIGYEYVQKHHPFIFEEHWSFQDRIPLRHGRLVLQLPP